MFKFTASAAFFLAMAAASQAAEAFPDPTSALMMRPSIDGTKTSHVSSSDRWAGLHAGLAAGYGIIWDSQDATANGADFGGFAGYTVQLKGPIYGGFEGEYMHMGREFSDNIGVIAQDTITAKLRIGYAHDRFLAYAVGGARYATAKVPFPHVPGLKSSDVAFVAGAGVDVAITDRIAIGAEYTRSFYQDFDRSRLLFPLDVRVQRINARLTYKIN